MLADGWFNPLPSGEQEELSDRMVEILNAYGQAELDSAMNDEFEGVYVVGVNLIAVDSGHRLSIRRRGYVETQAVAEAEELLRGAWGELHLS